MVILMYLADILLGLVAELEAKKPDNLPHIPQLPTGAYKPLLLKELPPLPKINIGETDPSPAPKEQQTSPTPTSDLASVPSDMDSLGKEIGLSEQNLQILQGRHAKRKAPIKFVDYSVDQQYSYNQSLIDSGALQTVQPVKGISSGKHQLRTLISSANLQRESLEESFASGKRNKKESGAKYGF